MNTPVNSQERITRGEQVGVNVAAIEREFSALWGAAGDGATAVTRACLANLVCWLEEDADRNRASVNESVQNVPARVMLVQVDDADSARSLETYISAICVPAHGGGKLVCSEEVTLQAGPQGLHHVAGVVRALLVPNVPSVVWVPSPPRRALPVLRALLPLADRMMVDSASVRVPADLRALHGLLMGVRQRVDVGWMGLWGMRSALASVFDHDEPRRQLASLHTVTLRCPRHRLANRLLLLGWFLDRVGLDALEVTERLSTSVTARAGNVRVGVEVLSSDGTAEPPMELRLQSQGPDVVLRRGSAPVAELETRRGTRQMALDPSTLGERLARAMAPNAPDPLMERALALALELLPAEAA
jgi:glucose-6-phosphate dehydrogenase assembly protein OpcA